LPPNFQLFSIGTYNEQIRVNIGLCVPDEERLSLPNLLGTRAGHKAASVGRPRGSLECARTSGAPGLATCWISQDS